MKVSRRMLILTAILILSIASMAAAKIDPFAGIWKGVAADGAKNQIRVTTWQGRYNVSFQDGASAVCGGGMAKGQGTGRAVNGVLVTAMTVKCANSGAIVANNYNVGLALSGGLTNAVDTAGTSYKMTHRAGCNGH